MNLETVPKLHWAAAYPFAILLMAVACARLYVIFFSSSVCCAVRSPVAGPRRGVSRVGTSPFGG